MHWRIKYWATYLRTEAALVCLALFVKIMPMSALKNDIVDKLLSMYSHRGDGFPTQFVNPDGPEAVTEITRLRAERDALRSAVISIRDDLILRSEVNGDHNLVAVGVGVWNQLNEAIGDDHA